MSKNEEKKALGRPRKFDDKALINVVKMYIQKHNTHPQTLKPTKISRYANELGLSTTYQDFTRSKKASSFIDKYNKAFKDMIFKENEIPVTLEDDLPIYERIDVVKLIKNNKGSKQIEEAVEMLNKSNEKLVESYGKIQEKMIIQSEKLIQQDKEIEKLKNELVEQKEVKEIELQKLKTELKRSKENQRMMSRKMALFEQFADLYHYDAVAEYALYLENIISEKVDPQVNIFNPDEYKSGKLNLKQVVDKYHELLLTVDNKSNSYYEEYQDGVQEPLNFDDEEAENNEIIIEKLTLDDMQNSLDRIFKK